METSTTMATTNDAPVQSSESPETPQQVSAKALLAEARATRDILIGFRSAVEKGQYAGVLMMDVAKGMAFLEAILKQNNAHIHNLQEQVK